MSTTTDRPSARGRKSTPADLLPLLTAAVRAVLTLLVPLVVLCIVGWIASVRSTSSLAAVARVGADLWLLAHGSSVAIVAGSIGIAPLGLTVLAALSARRAVRMWLRDQVDAERDVPFWRGLGTFTGGYAVLALLVAVVSRSGVAAASLGTSLLGGALVGGVGGLLALWAHRPARSDLLPDGVPPVVGSLLGRVWRPALSAVAGLLAVGSLLVTAALVHGHTDVLALHQALDPGFLGGILLTAAQVLLLPTLAVWGLAWSTGTGFAIGTGTSVAPGGTSLDTLPTVPVLGALPTPGATPAVAWLALAVPVLVGAGAWMLHARRTPVPDPLSGLLRQCAAALLTGVLAGIGVVALGFAASGPLGHGRLSHVGPDALLTGVVAGGEVAAGALIALLLGRVWRAWRGTKLVVALPDTQAAPEGSRKLLHDDS